MKLKRLPEEKHPEGKKHILIAVLLIVVAAAFWYSVSSFFAYGIQFNTGRIAALVGTLLLLGAMNGIVGIVGLVSRHKTMRIIIYFLGSVTHFIFFGLNFFSVVVVVLLWLFWWRYGRNTSWEEEHRTTFHTVKILTHTLGTLITFTVVALAFTYYGVVAQDEARSQRFIDSTISSASDAALATLTSSVDGFDADMTLDAFIERFAGEQLQEVFPTDFLPENLQQLFVERGGEVAQATDTLKDEAIAEFRLALLQEFGIQATGSEPIRDIVHQIVSERLNAIIAPYRGYVPPVLALSLFFALSAFGLLYFWTSVGMGYLIIKLLLLTRYFAIAKHEEEVERLILK